MLEKPGPVEFVKSAGSLGIVSAVATATFLVCSFVEHELKRELPTRTLLILAGASFCWGAYVAWANERRERIKLLELEGRADIRCEIYRASIDTERFDEHGRPIPIEDGICLSLLMKAVNHGREAWFGKWPEVDITFGAKIYHGTSTRLPTMPLLLEYDDMSLYNRRVNGLFQELFVGSPSWPTGLPRTGTLSFIVPAVNRNIMNVNTLADIEVTIFDSLDIPHVSRFYGVQILKSLVQQCPKEG
jgi:hypothetical protein